MKKHSLSHGAAVLVCTLTAPLLVDIVRTHIPLIHTGITKFSVFLVHLLPLSIRTSHLSQLLYATLLAAIWGAAFAFAHNKNFIRGG